MLLSHKLIQLNINSKINGQCDVSCCISGLCVARERCQDSLCHSLIEGTPHGTGSNTAERGRKVNCCCGKVHLRKPVISWLCNRTHPCLDCALWVQAVPEGIVHTQRLLLWHKSKANLLHVYIRLSWVCKWNFMQITLQNLLNQIISDSADYYFSWSISFYYLCF